MSNIVKIPFSVPLARMADEEAITNGYYQFHNCYMDEQGGINRRPGLRTVWDVAGPTYASFGCRGVFHGYDVNDAGRFYAFFDRYNAALPEQAGALYWLQLDANGVITASGASSTEMAGDLPQLSFATDGTYFFLAGIGEDRRIWYGSALTGLLTGVLTDADAPEGVTHLAWLDGYLLASNNTETFYWSDVNTPLVWSATNYASALGNADRIHALHVFNREIFLFGPTSLEIWYNDGETPFIRKPGGFYEIGLGARYSVVSFQNSITWITNDRRVMSYENGTFIELSTPFSRDLGQMDIVDCRGYVVPFRGRNFLVFNFNSANRTFAMETTTRLWSEWSSFDAASGQLEGFPILYSATDGLHTLGAYQTYSEILSFSDVNYEQIAGVTAPLKMFMQTGHVDYGTLRKKRSRAMRLRIKCGAADSYWDSIDTATRNPKLMLRWKDDNKYWSNEREIDLIERGGGNLVKEFRSTGIFSTRQYELSCTDPFPCVIVSGEEELEVLG